MKAKKQRKRINWKETLMGVVFLLAATTSILAVLLICLFLFANGLPAIGEIGPLKFLLGTQWRPSNDIYGILPMIVGSLYVTAGAIILGVPIGILTAVFLAKFCPRRIYKVLKPAVDLLAGIPSVVYGFFGIVVLVPFVRETFGGDGNSILTASILLGMMILPTIIGVSESAIRAVPDSYREGSFGLGAGRLRTVFRIVLPPAMPGILAGVILAIGRIVGESAALIYTAGTIPELAQALGDSARTLSVHMYVISNEGLYVNEAYATAVVLLVIVGLVNALSAALARRIAGGRKQED